MGLGAADYQLFLQKRGGEQVAELPWTQITWGWTLDNLSAASASIPISRPSHALAWAIAGADAWEHELSVWRNGEERWTGPLIQPSWDDGGTVLEARDLSQWWERRLLRFDREYRRVDLATIFEQLHLAAMAPDPSPNLGITTSPTGILGDRKIVGAARVRAADELRSLARDGVDYTVIGRAVIAGGAEVPVPRLPSLHSDCFAKPRLTGNGLLTADSVSVLGATDTSTGLPLVADYGSADDRRGLVERQFNDSGVGDKTSLRAAAKTRYDTLRETPLYLAADLVGRRCPPLSRFVPGARAWVEASCGVRQIATEMRLATVSVTVSRSDQGIEETVGVTFIPVGSIDSSTA